MILAILLIFIGTNNQIYGSEHNLRLQPRNSRPPSFNHHQSIREDESFASYGSIDDNYDDLDRMHTRYVSTPTPKFLYFEPMPNDPYERHMQEREKDPNKCKKAVCGTISCSTILSILGCLLFHHI
jgi:hypothetical protein